MASAEPSIQTIPATIKWRDIIHLDIGDPYLKQRTEAFLDRLENSTFRSPNPETGEIDEVNGQAVLQSIKERGDFLLSNTAASQSVARLVENVSDTLGIPFVTGKLTISAHDRPFNGSPENGSNTAFVLIGSTEFPIGISIGQDYLKGARYYGADGRLRPVLIEGVVANEIAHVAYLSSDEVLSNLFENAILVPLGGHPRKVDTKTIDFKSNQNGGYHSILQEDSCAGSRDGVGSQTPEAQPQIVLDTAASSSSHSVQSGLPCHRPRLKPQLGLE